MIYFIKAGNYIKIGYSENPEKRIKTIQTSSPINIEIIKLVQGYKKHEKEIHKRFDYINIKGEWYQETKELLDFIERLDDYDVLKIHKKNVPFYSSKKIETIEIINNKQGFSIITTEKIKKVGISHYINIRKELMEGLGLKKGDLVKITIERIEKE